MNNRFYINDEDYNFGDYNHVITPGGEEIPYSYMCSGNRNPPIDYRLVFETDTDDYRIVVDPCGIQDSVITALT